MSDWEDKLRKKIETPAEAAASAQRKNDEEEAANAALAVRAVQLAQGIARSVLQRAQLVLGPKFPDIGYGFTSMDDATLELRNKKLGVTRKASRSWSLCRRGNTENLVFNRSKGALVLESDQQTSLDLEQYFGRHVAFLVP